MDQRGGFGRFLVRLLFVALLVAGAAVGIGMYGNGQFGAAEVPAVKVDVDDRQGIILTLSGVIVPAKSVNVTSIVPGKIVELSVEEGTRVKKGDVIARIEKTGFRADHEEAKSALALAQSKLKELKNGALPEEISRVRAQLDEAQSQLDLASKEFGRADLLKVKGATTDSIYDARVAAKSKAAAIVDQLTQQLALIKKGPREELISAAEAEVERAQARCEKTRFYLDQTEITAPIDGTILERKANLGEVTRSDYLPTTLCILADLKHMQAEVDIQERDIQKIRIDQPCNIFPDALTGKSYSARVTRFQPQVNRQRGVVKSTITLDAPDDRLLAEMNCRVEFLDTSPEAKKPCLRVPNSAVMRNGTETTVYVLIKEIVAQRSVHVGDANAAGMLEVKQGLAAGDIVLIPGAMSLKVGQHVRPRIQ